VDFIASDVSIKIVPYRGNIIKPKEATTAPHVHYECGDDKESLWTLLMTNPDGHFTEDNSEYFHWMVANIKANDLTTGQTVIPYLQPFPAMGSGYHRHIFILFKQVLTFF
jgi:large subunit ribosomal protein L38